MTACCISTNRCSNHATGHGRITISVPVDLRKFGRPSQRFGLCNLTGNYWCSITTNKDETFDDTLRKVVRQMQAQKNSTACLKAPMLFHIMYHTLPYALVRRIFYKASPIPIISYTNIGVVDDQQLRLGSHTAQNALISTAIKHAPYFHLTVCSYRGTCILSSSLYGTEDDKKLIRKFFNGMINELSAL